VPPREVGVIETDLVGCSDGVLLANGAVLEMAGHAISASHLGVQCIDERCAVHGPGDISGAVVGIWGFYPTGRVDVSDIDIHDTPYAGIETRVAGRSRT
jgi:hypothetical protein